MGQITIKHVAMRSGFSNATVSRVLGGSSYPVNEKTRKKILQCAEELGYTPNLLARSLKKNISDEVAVVIPSLENPFYALLVKGIEKELSHNGFNTLIYAYDGSESTSKISDLLLGKRTAGIIFSGNHLSEEIIDRLKRQQNNLTPVIAVNFIQKEADIFSGIFFNYHECGKMTAEYLIKNGHLNTAWAIHNMNPDAWMDLKNGFCEKYQNAGCSFDSSSIFNSDIAGDFDAGCELAEKIIASSKPYTAISTNNDLVALGILHTLYHHHISVPEDISLISAGDITSSQMAIPSLTTIHIPAEKMGNLAASLISKNQFEKGKIFRIYLEPSLIEHETVKNISQS